MHKLVAIPTAIAMSIGLAACSSQPNQTLETARTEFSALQSNPLSQKYAALEVEDASKQLDKANDAYLNDADEERVDQLAYLANRRIDLAEQTIALRKAEEQIDEASTLRAKARLESREEMLKRQQEEIRQLQQDLQAKQTERGTLVTFGDVLFDLDKADLKPAGMRDVQKLADFLQENPDRKLVIEGYTDSTGSDSYNQQLSERRAEAVYRALIHAGVDAQRMQTVGYGEQYPVASNNTPASRAMNRRVEVTISNDNQRVAPRSSMQ
ncbi:OmpA family protein [Stutzerimonas xanthomarina]|uniref:OmpA family protein n=1 Tax=Stutzerimonas xanthomarina TaxID=271420 RepID=UPI003AA87E1B